MKFKKEIWTRTLVNGSTEKLFVENGFVVKSVVEYPNGTEVEKLFEKNQKAPAFVQESDDPDTIKYLIKKH